MIKLTLVAALGATVAACDMSDSGQTEEPKPAQRDVYSSLEDCVADWGDTELCERTMKDAREHELKMAEAKAGAAGGGGGTSFIPLFYGPTYYGNERFHRDSRGEIYQPTTQRAGATAGWNPSTRSPTAVRPASTPIWKGTPSPSGLRAIGPSGRVSGISSSSAGRGGFGGSGASASSGS